jgi:hypothetical protein
MKPTPQFDNFAQFWRFYLAEHSRPATRAWHFAGTTAAMLALAAIAVSRSWRWLPVVPLCGYALAWFSHLAIEGNRPATLGHPLWSLAADLKLWRLMVTGRLGRELHLGNDD